jgi:hypothetical protein
LRWVCFCTARLNEKYQPMLDRQEKGGCASVFT